MINRCILFVFLISFGLGNAQEKNEIEKRVKKREVPEDAKEWLKDAYEKGRKTKWYYQTDGEEKVYEAKLKHKKHLHSIEFDLEGEVQNVEIKIEENEIEPVAYKSIFDYLDSTFTKYSIKKIQIQYKGSGDDLEDLIDENEMEDLIVNYEIEYYGKSEEEDELWEGLFNQKGQLLQQRVVKLKATDNLDY